MTDPYATIYLFATLGRTGQFRNLAPVKLLNKKGTRDYKGMTFTSNGM